MAGQGRRFNFADALESATLTFWEHGYEGASLKLLTDSMGINPPRLYKAFGSKELFFSCIDHYNDTYGWFLVAALEQATSAIDLAARVLHGAAENYARPALPGGCLTINSAVTVTPANHHIAERLTQLRNANVDKIAAVFDADVRSRVLPKNTPSRTLATYLGTVVQGMSQQARDGANAEQLHRIAEMGLFTITSVVAPPTPRAK